MKSFPHISFFVLSITALVSPLHAYLGGFEVDDGYMFYEDTLSSVSSSAPEANSHGLVPPCTFPTLNTGSTPSTGGHACDFTRYDAGGSGSANGGPGGSPADIPDNSGLWQALEGGRLYEDTAWATRNDNNRNYITTYSIARSGQQSMDILTANKDDAGANLRYKYSLDSRDFNGETPTSVTSGRVVMTFYFCPTGFKSAFGGAGHLSFDPSSRMSLMDSNGNVGFRFGFDSFTNSAACNVAYEAQGGSVMLGQTANPNNWDGARITLNLDTDKIKLEYFVVTTGQWTTLVNNASMLTPMTNFSALEFWQAKGQFKNYWDDFSFEVLPPSCQITNTNVAGSVCNDNSTPNNTTDDYYTANVTVTFTDKPVTGNLVLSGAALHSSNSVTTVAVGSTTSATSHIFFGVRLKANGVANALISTFSADPACTMTVNPTAVSACSTPDCDMTNLVVTPGACNNNGTNNDEADDFYTADVTVNFSNKPASGNLVLSGAALHASNSVTTVAVGSTTSAGSHTFTGVRLKANGVANAITATFSADAACTLSVNAPSVNECSTPDCDITNLVVTPGACNDNGTPADAADDYYTASVAVTFSNKPASGNLVLSGVALHSSNSVTTVAVGSTTSATTHTYAGVRLKADGVANAITATFSADPACTMTINANAIPSCSTPVGCCPQLIIDVP